MCIYLSSRCYFFVVVVEYFKQVNKCDDPSQIGILRTREGCLSDIQAIERESSENKKSKLRAKYGLKEKYNPLLTLSTDLYRYVCV